jgi:hypothetical protein
MTNFREKFNNKGIAIVTASLALVAGLAWNEAFKNWFKNNKDLQTLGPWVYAIVITVIAVISIILLEKFT